MGPMVHDHTTTLALLTAWARSLPDAAAVWLFGSRARGDHRPGSDWDVAVLPLATAEDSLQRRLRLTVEAADAAGLSDDDLDLVTLDACPVLLAFRVIREGHLLAESDPVARTAFVERTFHRAQDAMRLRHIAVEARAARFGGSG
ncbi:MAG: hypothetical protein AMXMBFR64_23610 [Myxococcales bacterium]